MSLLLRTNGRRACCRRWVVRWDVGVGLGWAKSKRRELDGRARPDRRLFENGDYSRRADEEVADVQD